MEAIFPITDLHRNTKEVREAAEKGLVHITEGGRGAYIFCSEEVFEQQLNDAAQQAIYSERLAESIRAGKVDIAAGQTYEGVDTIMAAIDKAFRG